MGGQQSDGHRSGTHRSGADPDPLIGRKLSDKYKLLSLIASGGMGKVYRAEQAPLGRICAVKVLAAPGTGERTEEFAPAFEFHVGDSLGARV